MKYQTRPQKPHVFEAHQWFKNGDHPDDYKDPRQSLENGQIRSFTGELAKAFGWEGQVVRRYRRPDVLGQMVCKVCNHKMDDHGWVDQGIGGLSVCPGDYISEDPGNELIYRVHMKQSFEAMYDLVGGTKTGIQLIAEERQEQITKHGITVAHDVEFNDDEELALAAAALCTPYDIDEYTEEEILESRYGETPEKWDNNLCLKMAAKPTIERLKIAGALIAAEIDRLIAIGKK